METSLNTTPSLSIIVPVLNEATGIGASLQELAPLRSRGVEILLVDGGSEDDTTTLAAPHVDSILHTNRGRARQMNAGAMASCGDVLLFLHADTILPYDADQLILKGLQTTQKAWGRFDVQIDGASRMLPVVACLMNLRSRLTGIATGDQAIFVKRDTFFSVGPFPDQYLMEDIELSMKLKRHSSPLCLRDRVTTSGRRWEKFGVWPTIALMWRLRLLYWLGVPANKLAEKYR
jgi:rSAM/selenodomain-associated transferase 2